MELEHKKKLRLSSSFILLFILLLPLLISCSSDNKTKTTTVSIQSLDLSPNNLTITKVDTELLLRVVAKDLNGDDVNLSGSVVWQTSDVSLATVDAQGKITVHAPGKVKISASFGGLTDSVDVDINETEQSIQGKLFYEDRQYDTNGFTNSFFPTYSNVRFVTVDLLDEDGELLETTTTNSTGWFQFGHVIPELYSIRALSEITIEPAPGFSVKDMDGNIYAITKASVQGETTYDIKISKNSPIAGAFNILDLYASAAQYSREKLQVDVADLSVFWELNNGLGTYYCSGFDSDFCKQDQGVYVLNFTGGQFSDTDEYDDDVLLHEFGHFVMEKYFVDDSPAGCHFITTNDSDLSLAWSEGWGTFFGSTVKSWMKQNSGHNLSSKALVTSYVDTDGLNAFLSYDIAQIAYKDAAAESFYYASSEAAVSKILWSVFELYDIEKIRDVLVNHFLTTSQPTNLPNFWQGLLSSDLYDNGQLSGLAAIFAERQVFYQEDGFEIDDNVNEATLVQVGATDTPDHYLYKDDLSKDLDMFAFDVVANQSYRIETAELRNGIDTYIRMLDENGVVVEINGQSMENDDANPGQYYRFDNDPSCGANRFFNDKTSLASKLEFTSDLSGRYYVEVSHISTNFAKFGATGPYGSYRLTVEQVQ